MRSVLALALLAVTASATAQPTVSASTAGPLQIRIGEGEPLPVTIRQAAALPDGWLVLGRIPGSSDRPARSVLLTTDASGRFRSGTTVVDIPVNVPVTPFVAVSDSVHLLGVLSRDVDGQTLVAYEIVRGEIVDLPLAEVHTRSAVGDDREIRDLTALVPLADDALLFVGSAGERGGIIDSDPFVLAAAAHGLGGESPSEVLYAPITDAYDGLAAAGVGPDGRVVLGGWVRHEPTSSASLGLFEGFDLQFTFLTAGGAVVDSFTAETEAKVALAEVLVGADETRFVASATFESVTPSGGGMFSGGEVVREQRVVEGMFDADGRPRTIRRLGSAMEGEITVRSVVRPTRGAMAPYVLASRAAGDEMELLAMELEDQGWMLPLASAPALFPLAASPDGQRVLAVSSDDDTPGSRLHLVSLLDPSARPERGTLTLSNDAQYEGETLNGRPHGQGTVTYANGNRYTGAWVDGQKSGPGTFTYENGSTYVGEHANDRIEGTGRLEYADGGVYEGGFQDWKRHGTGTLTYPNGNRYAGAWVEGTREGFGTFTWADGGTYVGPFVDGAPNGEGVKTFPSGTIYRGSFRDWKLHGQGTYTFTNGNTFAGTFEDDTATTGIYTEAGGQSRPAIWDAEQRRYVYTGDPLPSAATPSASTPPVLPDQTPPSMLRAILYLLDQGRTDFSALRGEETRSGAWAGTFQPAGLAATTSCHETACIYNVSFPARRSNEATLALADAVAGAFPGWVRTDGTGAFTSVAFFACGSRNRALVVATTYVGVTVGDAPGYRPDVCQE